jgi:hypothetical protein
MASVQITLDMPDDLMREAQHEGLMSGEGLSVLIREALKRRKADEFFSTADRIAASGHSLTAEDVDSEIRAVREARGEDRAIRR